MDEIHERDMNTDFLFVAIRDMVETYPDLRVVLMSATVDTTIFSKYFFHCPIIEVIGKMFPVQQYFLEDAIEFLDFNPPPPKVTPDEDYDPETNKNLECDKRLYKTSTCMALSRMAEREVRMLI